MQDVIDAVSNTAICRWLFQEVGVAALLDTKFFIDQTTLGVMTFDEEHLYHSQNTTWAGTSQPLERAMHLEFSGSLGTETSDSSVFLGQDSGTPTRPETYQDCWYYHDYLAGNAFTYWMHQTFGNGPGGTWVQYGGILDMMPRGQQTDSNTPGGRFFYMPKARCELHQVNSERYGGFRLWGTNYACRESIFKGGNNTFDITSGPYGFSLGGVSVQANALFDIVLQNLTYAYYFYQVNGGTLRDVRIRRNFTDLAINDAATGMVVELVDCDPYQNVTPFQTPTGTYVFREFTSWNTTVVDETGTPVEGVRLRLTRDVPAFAEIINEETNAQGQPPSGEQLLQTTELEGSFDIADQVQFGPAYAFRARDYGRRYVALTNIARPPAPIVNDLIMPATGLTLDGTDDTAAQAITGVFYDESTQQLTLTEERTLNEIYSYGQWFYTQAAEISTDPAVAPSLLTAEGSTYFFIAGWDFNDNAHEDFVLLDGGVVELCGGDRWTTFEIVDVVPFTQYQVDDLTAAPVTIYRGFITDDGLNTFSIKRLFRTGVDTPVSVRARLQGFLPFGRVDIQNATITDRGLRVSINSQVDPNYKLTQGRADQTHFLWRNDDGSEAGATGKAAEDTDITGQATLQNVRLRVQAGETEGTQAPLTDQQIEYRRSGSKHWRKL